MQLGLEPEDLTGNPIIGILNTRSDINACYGHLRSRGGLAPTVPPASDCPAAGDIAALSRSYRFDARIVAQNVRGDDLLL
jgi:hypothetical protein